MWRGLKGKELKASADSSLSLFKRMVCYVFHWQFLTLGQKHLTCLMYVNTHSAPHTQT